MVTRALSNHHRQEFDSPKAAQQAVTYARDHVFERSAVQDERAILQAAMDRSMGQAGSSQVREEFEKRTAQGEFRTVYHGPHASAQQFTTAAMIRMEREIVGSMQAGNRQDAFSLASGKIRTEVEQRNPQLNQAQRGAIDQVLESREKIVGLDGVAGAGKTTTLSVIREGVEREGYRVEGFAPTSRAAQQLSGAGGNEKGEYARVKSVDAPNNLLTVLRADGSEQTYDPRRQQGVSVYRTEEKAFSVGDRIQFTAPANDLKVANRELGTVQSITDDGRIGLRMDGGRSVSINPREHPHLDHGYAVTSHSRREAVWEPRRRVEPIEKIYAWAEHERHWTPLNKALTPSEADQFGWRAETGTAVRLQLRRPQPAPAAPVDCSTACRNAQGAVRLNPG